MCLPSFSETRRCAILFPYLRLTRVYTLVKQRYKGGSFMNEQLWKLLQKARTDAALRQRIWETQKDDDPALAL